MNASCLNFDLSDDEQGGWKIAIGRGLAFVLADTCCLYMKTHGFHWNVCGEQFFGLHRLFKEQYEDMWTGMDALAIRIRELGLFVPGSLTEMRTLSTLSEQRGVPTWGDMLRELISDHSIQVDRICALRPALVEAGDTTSVKLVDERRMAHERMKWMLESSCSVRSSHVVLSVLETYA